MKSIRREFFWEFFIRSTWDDNNNVLSLKDTYKVDSKIMYNITQVISEDVHREINRKIRRL
jgi:hypothetical protein